MSTAGGDLAKGFRRWRQDGGYGGNVPPLHDTHGTIPSVVRRQRFRRNGFAHFVLAGTINAHIFRLPVNLLYFGIRLIAR